MLKNLLIYKFVIFNTLMAMLVGKLSYDGHTYDMATGYGMEISAVIFAVFMSTVLWTVRRVWGVSAALNLVKSWSGMDVLREFRRSADRDAEKMQWLTMATEIMFGLGILGTVWGFSVALSGVNQNDLASASGVAGAFGPLFAGLKIAMNTTIVGAFFGMWAQVNTRMLRTASVCLWSELKVPNDE